MISFCLLNEDALSAYLDTSMPNANNYNSAEDMINGLQDDKNLTGRLFSQSQGAGNYQTSPSSSWKSWLPSWLPFTDVSNAENRIREDEANIRRLKNEGDDIFNAWKNGTGGPGFLDSNHKWGWIKNAVMDNPIKTTALLGAGALGVAALSNPGSVPFFKKKQPQSQYPAPNYNYNRT